MKKVKNSQTIVADRYRIVTPIGQGAFGTTYEAEDLTNYKRVAIKVLSLRQTQDWKALDLFEREAQVLAHLDHPAIPKYLDYFYEDTSDDRQFYLVQELVKGESFATLIKKGWHANEEQIQTIALQILKILNYLHQLHPPVIHRDIKPQNIIRCPDGQVYLVDFGSVQDVYRHTLVEGGTFVGTVGYMPPEQFRGKAFFASDLYALGATLIFLLTHRSPEELPRKRMKIDFRDRVKISPEFANWLDKMLEPVIEDRYKSAWEAARVLRHLPSTEREVNGRNRSYPVSLRKTHRPKGTLVVLNRSNDCLILDFSDTENHSSVFRNRLVFLIFIMPILGFYLLAFLSLSPVVLIGIILLTVLMLRSVEPTRIEIDRSRFRLLYNFMGYTHEVERNTSSLRKVYLDISINHKGVKTVKCLLYASQHYEFGNSLTPVEKQWLVEEVSDFLRKLQQSSKVLQPSN